MRPTAAIPAATISKIEMMTVSDRFQYYDNRQAEIIEFPYSGSDIVAYIFLPTRSMGINDYIKQLTQEKNKNLLDRLSMTRVELSLPKFAKYAASYNMTVSRATADLEPYDIDFVITNKYGNKKYVSVKSGYAGSVLKLKHKRYTLNHMKPDYYLSVDCNGCNAILREFDDNTMTVSLEKKLW